MQPSKENSEQPISAASLCAMYGNPDHQSVLHWFQTASGKCWIYDAWFKVWFRCSVQKAQACIKLAPPDQPGMSPSSISTSTCSGIASLNMPELGLRTHTENM